MAKNYDIRRLMIRLACNRYKMVIFRQPIVIRCHEYLRLTRALSQHRAGVHARDVIVQQAIVIDIVQQAVSTVAEVQLLSMIVLK
jgi:hypothetical protein